MMDTVLTRHDVNLALGVVDTVDGAFLIGSYPVLKMKARDIDVAVPEPMHKDFVRIWGHRFDLTHNADEEVYTDDAPSFLANYRNKDGGGRVNILVIRSAYVEAMRKAAAEAAADPDAYRDSEARVALYQRWEREVSAWEARK